MKKILLVFDAYGELMSIEADLKKVGFDTVGISNELSINEKVLSFHPDVIVASGKSARVSSMSVGQKLKESVRFSGKVILSFAKDSRPSAADLLRLRLDAIIDSPVDGKTLIQAIAQLEGLKLDSLMEKFSKSGGNETQQKEAMRVSGSAGSEKPTHVSGAGAHEKTVHVSGGNTNAQAGVVDQKRRSSYSEFLSTHPEPSIQINHTNLSKEKTREAQNTLKKSYDFKLLEELDKLKREFAKALFKKD